MEDAAPPVAATRVGLDSTMADVIDDRGACRAIVEVIEAADPEAAHAFRTNTTWSERRELGESPFMHRVPTRSAGSRSVSPSCRRSARGAMVDV